jgi:hypothetical protein
MRIDVESCTNIDWNSLAAPFKAANERKFQAKSVFALLFLLFAKLQR